MSKASDSYLQQLLGDVVELAGEYTRGRLRVSVKTNYGPELPVFGASLSRGQGGGVSGADGFSLSRLLGFRAAVIVRDASGRTLATYGEPPATEPLRVALLVAVLAGLAFVFVRGVLK